MSTFPLSTNVLLALPPGLLPASSAAASASYTSRTINILSVHCPSSSHVQNSPNRASLSPKLPTCAIPSDGLIPDPVRPARCLRGACRFNLCYLQRCLPVLPPLCYLDQNICSLFPHSWFQTAIPTPVPHGKINLHRLFQCVLVDKCAELQKYSILKIVLTSRPLLSFPSAAWPALALRRPVNRSLCGSTCVIYSPVKIKINKQLIMMLKKNALTCRATPRVISCKNCEAFGDPSFKASACSYPLVLWNEDELEIKWIRCNTTVEASAKISFLERVCNTKFAKQNFFSSFFLTRLPPAGNRMLFFLFIYFYLHFWQRRHLSLPRRLSGLGCIGAGVLPELSPPIASGPPVLAAVGGFCKIQSDWITSKSFPLNLCHRAPIRENMGKLAPAANPPVPPPSVKNISNPWSK